MSRFPAVLAGVCALVSGAGMGLAQSPSPPAPAPPTAAPAAPADGSASMAAPAPEDKAGGTAAPLPVAHNNLSPETAALLNAGRPAYNLPKPAVAPKPAAASVDLPDPDLPKNGIIRLPQYIVHPPKNPIFREQDLNSKEQLANLAMQRYKGLSLVPFSDLNKPVALQMYLDDVRQQNMSDLSDAAAVAAHGGDAAESEYIKRISQDTYSRSFDFGGPLPMQRPSQ